jgi:hypothetical protein
MAPEAVENGYVVLEYRNQKFGGRFPSVYIFVTEDPTVGAMAKVAVRSSSPTTGAGAKEQAVEKLPPQWR